MSSNKNETAVHGCNPAISVLVVLVSHKVYFLSSTISLAVLFVYRQFQALGGMLNLEVTFEN